MSALFSLVERYLRAYNAADLDAWAELLHDDVVMTAETGTMVGRDAARAYAAGTLRAFPGLRAELLRVVAETDDTIVVEYRLENPAPERYEWLLAGTVCDIHAIRDGRIAACRSYYLPDAGDRTEVAPGAAAIASAQAHEELMSSRARVVAAADETRRRIQRDLHDGAQQRLVHSIITLRLAETALRDADGPARDLVCQALSHVERATAELRELVQGIMPAALLRGGLRQGVESLLDHVDLPVELDLPDVRLPPAIETTAYFFVAEALTNAVKHSGASRAAVTARLADGGLELEFRDDGRGGADPERGSGLLGLVDRVAAGGGTLEVTSRHGAGTVLAMWLPIGTVTEAREPVAAGR